MSSTECRNTRLGISVDVHPSTVCQYFSKWLDVLCTKLHVFINWPERENLLKTMAMVFQKAFQKCAVIIDCFELSVLLGRSMQSTLPVMYDYIHWRRQVVTNR